MPIMPSVVGLDYPAALEAMVTAGVRVLPFGYFQIDPVSIAWQTDSAVNAGVVISQSPPAGSTVGINSSATLSVSSYAVAVAYPAGGTQTDGVAFSVPTNPAPVLISISPLFQTAGGGQFTLTLTGSSFMSGSLVRMNGVTLATTFISSTGLAAAVPASLIATAGSYSIIVSNPAPGGGQSGALVLTISNPIPTLASISPSTVAAGSAAFSLTLTGSNFNAQSIVYIGSTALATQYVGPTGLTATVTAALIAAGADASVTVANPIPGGGTSGAKTLVVNNPVPTLSSIAPNSDTAGGAGFTLSLTGTNFNATSVVYWGATALTTTYGSTTALTAAVTATQVASAGSAAVTVVNPTPAGGTSGSQTFTINSSGNPNPTLLSISPTSITAGGSGFTITCNGQNYISSSVVNWNGVGLTTTYVSASQITAVVPSADYASGGTASVTVTNPGPGGGTTGAQTITLNNPVPTLTSISPTSETAGGAGFNLTLTGTLFNTESIAYLGSTALSTTYSSTTSLTAAVTAAQIATYGSLSITVKNPTPGGGTSGAKTLTVNNPVPTLSSISPTSKVALTGTFTLTATGTNFVASSVVNWNGAALTTTYVSPTSITASVPGSDITVGGTEPVTVTNPSPGGGTSSSQTFTINNPVPTPISISPSSVAYGGSGFTLTVTGTEFVTTSTVNWNGSPLTTTYVSSTSLTAAVPSGDIASSGTATVTVVNPTPGGGTSSGATFTISGAAGYDGTLAVNAIGQLVNGHGTQIQLRGLNTPADSQITETGDFSNPGGSYSGLSGYPLGSLAKNWNANCIRITINVGAWLGLTYGELTGSSPNTAAWSGSTQGADPDNTYKQYITNIVNDARRNNLYIIINSHWSAPSFTLGGTTHYVGAVGQPMFMDYDTTYPYWTAGVGAGPGGSTGIVAYALANWVNPATGTINDIVWELFNEPFLDQQSVNFNTANNGGGSSQTYLQIMLNGGYVSGYSNQYIGTIGTIGMPKALCGPSSQPNTTSNLYTFNYWWRATGYQPVLTGIRGLGATNVLMVNGGSFSSKQGDIPSVYPTDTLSPPQVGTGWHPYELSGGAGFPTSETPNAAANQNGTSGIGHAVPVTCTEGGNNAGTEFTTAYYNGWASMADTYNIGIVAWQWNSNNGAAQDVNWYQNNYGSSITWTAGISGTTMTVTGTPSSSLGPGIVITAGSSQDRCYIQAQLSGTVGGAGTYQVSVSQTVSSGTSFTGNYYVPSTQGGGGATTLANWMLAHAP